MKIYTRGGDQGFTSLMNQSRVPKTDDRIELLGTIDELSSHIGLSKVLAEEPMREKLSQVQSTLMKIMAGVASSSPGQYRMTQEEVTALEAGIDEIESSFPRQKAFVLYGGCELSARLDVARAVARRAERVFCRVTRFYHLDAQALKYMNRLADYLYICARYADHRAKSDEKEGIRQDVIRDVFRERK